MVPHASYFKADGWRNPLAGVESCSDMAVEASPVSCQDAQLASLLDAKLQVSHLGHPE